MIRVVLLLGMLVSVAMAQEANPVAAAARKQILMRAKHLVEAAQEMPADKYGFKASEKQATFGHMVFHTGRANSALCGLVGGEKSQFPQDLKDTDPKEKLVAALEQSVTYCDGVLAKATDKNLGENLKTPWGAEMTRAELLLEINADLADHYSLAATYLRLNGLLPPTAKK